MNRGRTGPVGGAYLNRGTCRSPRGRQAKTPGRILVAWGPTSRRGPFMGTSRCRDNHATERRCTRQCQATAPMTREHRPLDPPLQRPPPPRENRHGDSARLVQAILCRRTRCTSAFITSRHDKHHAHGRGETQGGIGGAAKATERPTASPSYPGRHGATWGRRLQRHLALRDNRARRPNATTLGRRYPALVTG